jgi:hypothetical protein
MAFCNTNIEVNDFLNSDDITNIEDIGEKILFLKLNDLKKVAKKMGLGIKGNMNSIRFDIQEHLYNPEKIFMKLINPIKILLENEEIKDKNGKDFWLFKFKKYKIQDNYKIEIKERHISESYNSEYTHGIAIHQNDSDITKCHKYFINIKNDDTDIIKQLSQNEGINYVETTEKNKLNITRVNDEFIKEIIDIGGFCYESRPCQHTIKIIGQNDKIYTVKYVCYTTIRKILLKTMSIDNLSEHFQKKK